MNILKIHRYTILLPTSGKYLVHNLTWYIGLAVLLALVNILRCASPPTPAACWLLGSKSPNWSSDVLKDSRCTKAHRRCRTGWRAGLWSAAFSSAHDCKMRVKYNIKVKIYLTHLISHPKVDNISIPLNTG